MRKYTAFILLVVVALLIGANLPNMLVIAYDAATIAQSSPNLVTGIGRLKSYNIADNYVRHANSRFRIDPNVNPFDDSRFRFVPGLADASGISFESVNFPGKFLRHRGGEIWLDTNDNSTVFRADATWRRRPPLASNWVSYESYNFPGEYIRHQNSLLNRTGIGNDLDRADATFQEVVASGITRLQSFNFQNSYVRHANSRFRIDPNVNPLADSQFRIVAGLADASAISFESVNFPGKFLRHRGGQLWLDTNDNSAVFKADATWRRRIGLASPYSSYESYNFPGEYLRHHGSFMNRTGVVSDLDRADATFLEESSGGTVPTNTPAPTNTPGGATVLGYFVEWGIYVRNYQPKNIVTSGSASKLTHINFAFGNVTNGSCIIGDSYADYDKAYTAAESIDGVADTWDAGVLRGIFGQFRKLKRMYPHIKILYSFGGWSWSGGFGQAAANATAFANSCYNLVEDPRWADVFDGIDIDWEYPNSCGLSCDSSGFGSFKTLMSALRTRFGPNYLVTAAITADGTNGGKIDAADYGGAAQYLNWYNVMTYDYFGAFDADGPTAPHSPLTSYAGIPIAGFHSDAAIQKLKSKGIPASKLLLGIGFYGRGWTGVSQAAPGGSASGAAPGSVEPGIEDYKVLVIRCPATGTVGGTAYAFCAPQWWGYDTPGTIASKMTYKKQQGLGGAFFWEMSGDTANGALITAMYNNR